jgi:hypothetical protein
LNWRPIFVQPIVALFTHAAADPATTAHAVDDSSYERFALPYKFQPRLSVPHAIVFALRALLRIFLGSILFGVWGAYTLLAWSSIHNPFVLAVTLVPMFAVFLALLAGVMVGTSRLSPRRLPR